MGRQQPTILPEIDLFVEALVTTTCYFNTTLNTTKCDNLSLSTLDKPVNHSSYSLWLTILLGVAVCLISLLTVFGNVVMILAFVIEQKIRQPDNYFVVSLAVTDLIIGSFGMPLYSLYALGGSWVLGHWLCRIWLSVDWSSFLTARYTVLLMTLNRFLETKFPLKYQSWRSRNHVLIVIALLHVTPIVIFFTLFMKTFDNSDISSADTCDIPFVSDALFTCLFVIGYYWFAMVATGILHAANYHMLVHKQEISEENYRRDIESCEESSSQQTNETMLNNTRLRQQKNNNSVSVCRVTEIKTENTSKSKKGVKPGKNMQPYFKGFANLKKSALIAWRARHEDDMCSRDTDVDSKEEDMRFIKVDQSPGLVTGFRANMCKSNYPGRADESVFISNFKTGDQKMSKDLLWTSQLTNTYRIGLQRLTSPSHLPLNSSGSMFQWNPPKTLNSVYSSAFSDRSEKQARPLLKREIRRRSQIIAEESPPTTRSSKTAVLSLATGESEREDMDTTDPHTSSTWKRRSFLLRLAFGVFDLENVNHRLWTKEQTTTTDLTTSFTAHSSAAYRYVAHEQRPFLDNRNPEIFIGVSDGGTQPHNEPLGDVGVRGDSLGNNNNNKNNDPDEDITDPTSAARRSDRSATLRKITNSKKSRSIKYELNQRPDGEVIPDDGLSSSETSYPFTIQPTGINRPNDRVFVKTKNLTGRRQREKRERKTLRTISFIFVSYMMCWTPYQVLVIMLAVCTSCVNMRLYSFTYWLSYLSSCINPICYAYANTKIKRAVIRVLKLDWKNHETVV